MNNWSIKEINRYCAERPNEVSLWINQAVAKYICTTWSSAVVCLSLVLSTYLNYQKYHQFELLFSYVPTILFFIAFPVLNTVSPRIIKVTHWYFTLTALCFMIGILHVVSVIDSSNLPIRNYPIQLAIGIPALFSFHRSTKTNISIALTLSGVCAILLHNIDNDLLVSSLIQFIQGLCIGIGFNLFFMQSLKVWYVSQTLNTTSMVHAFDQLQKIVFPHQIERIKAGDSLEDTMPCGLGRGCAIVFDIQGSSQIKHPLVKEMLGATLRACEEVLIENYTSQPLSSNGYRIKELGDGFVCSVGFPFKQPDSQNMFDLAVDLVHRFQQIVDLKLKEFNYNDPVYSGAGIAYGEMEGFFPSTGVKQYDLYGRAIVLATRYESMRKSLFAKKPELSGHVTILHEAVWHGLSREKQQQFQRWELKEDGVTVRDDASATIAFYEVDSSAANLSQKVS